MSNELTEAERAIADVIKAAVFNSEITLVCSGAYENLIRDSVAAVTPIIRRETLAKFGDRIGRFNP
jgi:hypothetical protein